MKKFLFLLVLACSSALANAASVSIAKRIEIELGQRIGILPPAIAADPDYYSSPAVATRDRGMLAVAWKGTNTIATRFDAAGSILWSRPWPSGVPKVVLHTVNDEFLTLTPPRISRFSGSGDFLMEAVLPLGVEQRPTQYRLLVESPDGCLVSGATGEGSGSPGFFFLMQFSRELGSNGMWKFGMTYN